MKNKILKIITYLLLFLILPSFSYKNNKFIQIYGLNIEIISDLPGAVFLKCSKIMN